MRIALLGLDGSGKSTLTRTLRSALGDEGCDVSVVDKWDIYQRDSYPECRLVGVELDELRRCIAEMKSPSSALFLFWAIRQTLPDDAPGKIFLLDGYWQKHAATEIVFGCNADWVRSTAAIFPPADLTFYLRIDPTIAYVRKADFTHYECGKNEPSRERFVEHQNAVRLVFEELFVTNSTVIVDGSLPRDEVFRSVKNTILARFRTRHA